jgi:hypothetical protein
MSDQQMEQRIAKVLGENPELAFEFYCMASEVVDDFEDYGPVLQADEEGVYSDETAIKRLQAARSRVIELLREPGNTTEP